MRVALLFRLCSRNKGEKDNNAPLRPRSLALEPDQIPSQGQPAKHLDKDELQHQLRLRKKIVRRSDSDWIRDDGLDSRTQRYDTSTSWPARRNPTAADKPAIPAPTIMIFRDCVESWRGAESSGGNESDLAV